MSWEWSTGGDVKAEALVSVLLLGFFTRLGAGRPLLLFAPFRAVDRVRFIARYHQISLYLRSFLLAFVIRYDRELKCSLWSKEKTKQKDVE